MEEKTIEELEKVKASNKRAWDTYGSELCAGEMIGEERALKDKIAELKSGIPKNIQKLKLDDKLLLSNIPVCTPFFIFKVLLCPPFSLESHDFCVVTSATSK